MLYVLFILLWHDIHVTKSFLFQSKKTKKKKKKKKKTLHASDEAVIKLFKRDN